jgi:hypothetical protein
MSICRGAAGGFTLFPAMKGPLRSIAAGVILPVLIRAAAGAAQTNTADLTGAVQDFLEGSSRVPPSPRAIPRLATSSSG